MAERSDSAIRAWLWLCACLVAAMVVVGGATRLTGSGLSITEWAPVSGALPPLSADAWDELFRAYQNSPQYRLENTHFSLGDFKAIFWWEWAHRLLGRVIGLALAIPLAVFWATGRLTRGLKRRGLLTVALVAFQGALGWFMVASGLVEQPRVSHLRLASHLLTALLTLSVIVWTALDLGTGESRPSRTRSGRLVGAFTWLLSVQIGWGAFVAGLRAGLVYPTWPRMGNAWIPPDIWGGMSPLGAFVNHPVAVQFFHRWLGAAVLLVGLAVVGICARRRDLRGPAFAVAVALCGQFALGVLTVLRFYLRPVTYGVSHQAGAVVLLTAAIVLLYRAGRDKPAAEPVVQPE